MFCFWSFSSQKQEPPIFPHPPYLLSPFRRAGCPHPAARYAAHFQSLRRGGRLCPPACTAPSCYAFVGVGVLDDPLSRTALHANPLSLRTSAHAGVAIRPPPRTAPHALRRGGVLPRPPIRCGIGKTGGEIAEVPPVADEARRFRGSAPIGGHDSGRESAGTTVGKRAAAPTQF